jgi:hypothetical protein
VWLSSMYCVSAGLTFRLHIGCVHRIIEFGNVDLGSRLTGNCHNTVTCFT